VGEVETYRDRAARKSPARPWAILAIACAACGHGAASSEPHGNGARDDAGRGSGATALPDPGGGEDLGASPGGDLVPSVLSLDRGAGSAPAPAQSIPNPDRDGLVASAGRALEEGRADEAAAYLDVVLLVDPGDAEALELRARSLEAAGDEEGALSDLDRCCELGRDECCR